MTATDTSRAAYHATTADREAMCARLIAAYRVEGGMTDRAMGRLLEWHPSQVSARRNDLINAGVAILRLGVVKDEVTRKPGIVWGFELGTLGV